MAKQQSTTTGGTVGRDPIDNGNETTILTKDYYIAELTNNLSSKQAISKQVIYNLSQSGISPCLVNHLSEILTTTNKLTKILESINKFIDLYADPIRGGESSKDPIRGGESSKDPIRGGGSSGGNSNPLAEMISDLELSNDEVSSLIEQHNQLDTCLSFLEFLFLYSLFLLENEIEDKELFYRFIKPAHKPYRYDFELERVVNYDTNELDANNSWIEVIENIENRVPGQLLNLILTESTSTINFEPNQIAAKIKSALDNKLINLKMTFKDTYYIVVNPDARSVKVLNNDMSFSTNTGNGDTSITNETVPYSVPNGETYNNTIYTYRRVGENKSILTQKSVMMYGVQPGDFESSEFMGIDFSIGNI